MIGIINSHLEATLHLKVVGMNSQTEVTAVIDTGYNGALSLSAAVIASLSLSPLASRSVTLGDASRRVLDFYETEVIWNGQTQSVAVLCVEGDPLIGTALLKDCKLEADFIAGGQVQITPITQQ